MTARSRVQNLLRSWPGGEDAAESMAAGAALEGPRTLWPEPWLDTWGYRLDSLVDRGLPTGGLSRVVPAVRVHGHRFMEYTVREEARMYWVYTDDTASSVLGVVASERGSDGVKWNLVGA